MGKLFGNKLSSYIYLFSILFAVGVLIFFPKWIVDDAYIIFRYSENLVHHSQLTYNLNTNPVEGYTGLILPLLIAFAMKVGISPVFAAHFIGIISYIIGGIFLFLVLKKIKITDIISSIIVLLYTTTPIIYTHVFSGLETILFTSTIIITIYFSLILLQDKLFKSAHYILFSFLLLFFSLLRPEGVLFSILISIFCLLYYFTEKKYLFNKLFITIITVFIIPFIIYFLLRWNYYGQFFPNTFYLKSGNFDLSLESFNSFLDFFNSYLGIPFIITLIVLFINIDKVWIEVRTNKNKMLSKEFLYVLLPTLIFTILILFQYFHSNLLMNFSYRFFVPIFPILLIILSVSLTIGFDNIKELSLLKPLTSKGYIILIALLLFVHFDLIIFDFKREVILDMKKKTMLDNVQIPAGKFIEANFSKDSILLVHADAGAIPYFSKLKTIDFGGLNDSFLSHRDKLSKRQIIDYFFKVNADVLAISSFSKDNVERNHMSLNWDTLGLILKDKRFKRYTLVKIFDAYVWHYYVFVFVKNELLNKKLYNNSKF